MYIDKFLHAHITQAAALALMVYEEERENVSSLPLVPCIPELTDFAENGLGVAAFEHDKMIGFLCCYSPFHHAFGSTDVTGIFSPMGANAAVKKNRAKIYAAMYQAAAVKWVEAGAVSHAVCLYAHDEELQRQFYHYGFGLRCMDAIRPMKQINCTPCINYEFTELDQKQYQHVYSLDFAMNRHFCKSPFFMNRKPDTMEEFMLLSETETARYFVAKQQGDLCAFLKITDTGETFITNGSTYCHINGAYCVPEHRSKGMYQNLMNYAITKLQAEGYTELGVDFESFNPSAYGFWLKYFTAYTHGVVRRIDERILSEKDLLS